MTEPSIDTAQQFAAQHGLAIVFILLLIATWVIFVLGAALYNYVPRGEIREAMRSARAKLYEVGKARTVAEEQLRVAVRKRALATNTWPDEMFNDIARTDLSTVDHNDHLHDLIAAYQLQNARFVEEDARFGKINQLHEQLQPMSWMQYMIFYLTHLRWSPILWASTIATFVLASGALIAFTY